MAARLPAVFEALGRVERPLPSEFSGFTTEGGTTLDADVLANVANRLMPQDLAALGSTCRDLSAVAANTYPGIKLRLWPHQRASLSFLLKREASTAVCGGALADEPGTGKTITMLSLICKTAGQRTPPPPNPEDQRREEAEAEWSRLDLAYKRAIVLKMV